MNNNFLYNYYARLHSKLFLLRSFRVDYKKRGSIITKMILSRRPRKRILKCSDDEEEEAHDFRVPPDPKRHLKTSNEDDKKEVYNFRVLLPNGQNVELVYRNYRTGAVALLDFMKEVKHQYEKLEALHNSPCRDINWDGIVHLENPLGKRIGERMFFSDFSTKEQNILTLHDGKNEKFKCEILWDLTPDTDLLSELPEEYTFETALADLIDNSLQALWSNAPEERKLISLSINDQMVSIFDTGQGMDGTKENCIAKWGRMGSSNHRSMRKCAIGGDPPYLTPFFGMYGYGGLIASMHLGRSVEVSSKTRRSKNVFGLSLSRESLLEKSETKSTWKTSGGIRDPLDSDMRASPHGSFTKVEIHNPRESSLTECQLKGWLKDVYFPYIQCDTMVGTSTSVEFVVNGVNLTEVHGGEVAVTNLNSSRGPNFVLQVCFRARDFTVEPAGSSPSATQRIANARLKCVYFPIVEGKESIDSILEEIASIGIEKSDNFNNFSRVSIRRLGRLLPDAKWGRLPFMEPKHKRGEKVELLRRCCLRVKCFVETDAGFSPTVSKTDLAHKDLFTIALKNLGLRPTESFPAIEIRREGKVLSLSQLEREYEDWILAMHNLYDEEADSRQDPPTIVTDPCKPGALGVKSKVVRLHRVLRRRGTTWRSGQTIKVLKGVSGNHKKDLYATFEYFLLEGLEGEVGGEARIICRPLECGPEMGALLVVDDENATFDIRNSLSFPVGIIDSGKCRVVDDRTWKNKQVKHEQRAPSRIDILDLRQCQQIEIHEALPFAEPTVSAGYIPPRELVAVIRPQSYNSSVSSSLLDQKFIVKIDVDMMLEVTSRTADKTHNDQKFLYKTFSKPSARKGLHGLYIFKLDGSHMSELFQKAGSYVFSFSVTCDTSPLPIRREVQLKVCPCVKVGKWELFSDSHVSFSKDFPLRVRVGFHIPCLSIACFDIYANRMPFTEEHELSMKVCHEENVLAVVDLLSTNMSPDKMMLKIEDIMFQSGKLDLIRPHYEACLLISSSSESQSVKVPCLVLPGPVHSAKIMSNSQLKMLQPEDIIHELIVEVFDAYNNHAAEGEYVHFRFEGLTLQDQIGPTRKVNDKGLVNLSGNVKVTSCHNNTAKVLISSGNHILVDQDFPVSERNPEHIPKISIMKVPKQEDVSFPDSGSQPQELDGTIVPFGGSSQPIWSSFSNVLLNDEKRLCEALGEAAKMIKFHEENLNILEEQIKSLENDLYALQASDEKLDCQGGLICSRENVSRQIAQMKNTAPSVLCKLKEDKKPKRELLHGVIGIVALLGRVGTKNMSRVFSEYLGERRMTAIVCKSYAAARELERYGEDGSIDCSVALHGLGSTINHPFAVICVDDISPYSGGFSSDGKLELPNPRLPSGEIPNGFLGFAVNMITLDQCHFQSVTSSALGLRETLFYYLFGELQVYRTRADLENATDHIKVDAVSLDGGILSRRGIIFLGKCNPSILFPVMPPSDLDCTQLEKYVKVEEIHVTLEGTREQRVKEQNDKLHWKHKFEKRKSKLQRFIEEKQPLIDSIPSGLKGSLSQPIL